MAKKFSITDEMLTGSISKIAKSASEMDGMVSVAAANCILFAIETGRFHHMGQLMKALGGKTKGKQSTMWRVTVLGDWFVKHGPVVKADGEDEFFKFSPEKLAKLKPEFDADWVQFGKRLVENPFWKERPEPPFKGTNVYSKLASVVKAIKDTLADAEKAKHEKNQGVSEDNAQLIEAFLAGLKSGKRVEVVTHAVN